MLPQKNKSVHRTPEYRRGINDEQTIIQWLTILGYDVRPASADDNIHGIDAYVDGIAVDFKSHKYSPHYFVNFCFEYTCFSKSRNKWVDGWFQAGRADAYIYMLERQPGVHSLYWVDKQAVIDYGFDFERNLSVSVRIQQEQNGHDHINSTSGYILVENISYIGRELDKTSELSELVAHTARSIARPIAAAH
jgi:hypothetical protein